MTRVLVCGGRDFADIEYAERVLNHLHESYRFTVVIEGDSRGADRIAGAWAVGHGIDNVKFRAKWAEDGLKAGPIRNQRMLDEGKPDLVVAFKGGAGTADTLRRAAAALVPVMKIASRTAALGVTNKRDGDYVPPGGLALLL